MAIAKGRVAYFSFSALTGLAAAIWGQPLIHCNQDAANIIVTVFSVLAGFLVAMIALIGDPSAAAARGSWRFTELNRQGVAQRLARNRWMFVLYLLTLALVFAASLCKMVDGSICYMDSILSWIERIYLGLAVTAFLLSFRLPWALTRMQMEHYDELIDRQRKAVGIQD